MTPLPRAECPVCDHSTPVLRSGAFRKHGDATTYGEPTCSGSGWSLRALADERGPRAAGDETAQRGPVGPNPRGHRGPERNDGPKSTPPANDDIALAVIADGVAQRRLDAERAVVVPPTGGPVWKSLMGATGSGWICERATMYRELVRDPATGYRLDFGMPERVIFGIALDAALREVMEEQLRAPLHAGTIGVDQPAQLRLVAAAVAATARGAARARGNGTDEPWTDEDWSTLRTRLATAVDKFLGLWPNRVDGKAGHEDDPWGHTADEPDGTPAGPPVTWLPLDGLDMQVKLTAPDVVGGRGVSGKPDFVWRRDGVIEGWADLKAGKRGKAFPAAWTESEAVTYDYLVTNENGGQPPLWHAYIEYVRLVKPYWQVKVDDVRAPATLDLARAYFARWGRALDSGDVEEVSFTPNGCASCSWRDPIPDAGHEGCAIGQSVIRLTKEDSSDDPAAK